MQMWWTQHLFLEDTKYKNTSCAGFYVFSSRCCLGQLKVITKLLGPASAIKKYATLPVTFPVFSRQIFLFMNLLLVSEESFKLLS